MISLIVFGRVIIHRTISQEKKTSASAGWWAGLVLSVFFITNNISSLASPHISIVPTQKLSLITGICTAILGSTIVWVLKPLIQNRAVGVITLLLSASGLCSLFSYFYIQNMNHFLLSGILGLAFGLLLHLAFFPNNFHGLFQE